MESVITHTADTASSILLISLSITIATIVFIVLRFVAQVVPLFTREITLWLLSSVGLFFVFFIYSLATSIICLVYYAQSGRLGFPTVMYIGQVTGFFLLNLVLLLEPFFYIHYFPTKGTISKKTFLISNVLFFPTLYWLLIIVMRMIGMMIIRS